MLAQGYQAQEVNFQAPLLSVCQLDLDMSLARNSVGHDSTIPRSPEVENIPFHVDAVPDSMTTKYDFEWYPTHFVLICSFNVHCIDLWEQ